MMQSPVLTARDFFDVVIVPDVEDAKANPHNVRLVIHALISLHQMNDRYFNEQPVQYPTKRAYYDALAADCEARYAACSVLERVRDLATNAKHCAPVSAPQADFGTSAMDASSPLTLTAIAKSEDGTSQELLPIILESFTFWKSEVDALVEKK